ncbi:MAG TPA: hypothetical protein VIY27_11205 [Myxococcota bacterium]
MTVATIADLTASLADELGLDDIEAAEAAVRANRVGRYEDHRDGSPEREALSRAVWADVTGGAEWPF